MKRLSHPTTGFVPGDPSDGPEEESFEQDLLEAGLEFDADELREFLSADLMDVPIDPAFKRRLRSKLWNMVRFRSGRPVGRTS